MLHFLPLLAPPETTNYMLAGYVVIFSVMVLYIASLLLRRKKLEQDLKTLEELDGQGPADPP